MTDVKIIEPTQDKFNDLATIAINLRRWTKTWKEKYGCQNRERMEYWQSKMDHWIELNTEKV